MKILFKVREFVWVIVSEIEDWVYPYRTRLTEEEKYEHGMKDPMTCYQNWEIYNVRKSLSI